MIGYIAMYGIDHEGCFPVTEPSIIHATAIEAEAEAETAKPRADYYDSHQVEYPEPAPTGWAVAVEDDGQLGLVPA